MIAASFVTLMVIAQLMLAGRALNDDNSALAAVFACMGFWGIVALVQVLKALGVFA